MPKCQGNGAQPQQIFGGKGAWGKGGKGAYSVEDDWSSGVNGYNFGPYPGHEDIHMFLNTLAQEATGDWQVAMSKNANKSALAIGNGPTGCVATVTGAHKACPCLVSEGRYHALSDAVYYLSFGTYDPSDLDFNIPMMMVTGEEGGVPLANVVAPGHSNNREKRISRPPPRRELMGIGRKSSCVGTALWRSDSLAAAHPATLPCLVCH